MIEISNVSKHYGKTPVLRNISAQLQSGTIYGLVGANGCGKTTLIRCICGFAKPDAGFVRVDGKVIGKDCDFAPSMGIIIETPGFLSHMTARQNLSILSRITGKVSDSQISDVIRRVGLDPDDRKPVGKYSLGMRQRLGIAQSLLENPTALLWDEPVSYTHLTLPTNREGIAQSLLENPTALLWDEPFNGLDAAGIADIHRLLQERKSLGNTILLVSHSEADIAKACD